jgi:hypothetical protein
VKPALAAPRDGKILENLGLQRRAEPFGLPYPILLRRRLEFGERGDAKLLVEPQYLLRAETCTVSISSTLAGISFRSFSRLG